MNLYMKKFVTLKATWECSIVPITRTDDKIEFCYDTTTCVVEKALMSHRTRCEKITNYGFLAKKCHTSYYAIA